LLSHSGSVVQPAGRQGIEVFPKRFVIMYYVYAIRSLRDKRIYVDMTSNVVKCVVEHNNAYQINKRICALGADF
jgi:hypothetical protein